MCVIFAHLRDFVALVLLARVCSPTFFVCLQWLVRGLLASAAGGLDRAHIYMLRNVNDRGTGKFTTCGLTSSKQTGPTPKISWYFVKTIMTLIGDMVMVKAPKYPTAAHPAGDAPPLVAKFAKPGVAANGGASAAYVVWLPSKNNAEVANYALELTSAVGNHSLQGQALTLVQLVMNSTNGNQSSLGTAHFSGDEETTVTIPLVSEVPVLVLVGVKPSPPSGAVPPVTPPVYWQCKSKPSTMGLYCDTNTSASAYFVCPQGQRANCPDGQHCVQTDGTSGVITCVDAPSPCKDRGPGLYCTPAEPKPSPAWPDSYVVCPQQLPLWCPVEKPHCVQGGASGSATCVARQ
jgi:hypothetical protein